MNSSSFSRPPRHRGRQGWHILSRHRLGFLVFGAFLAASSLALTLAGSSHAQSEPAVTSVKMSDFAFDPKEIHVAPGAFTLHFVNTAGRKHNFVIQIGSDEQRIPDLDAGKETDGTFTLAQPGSYQFMCDLPTHASRGMVGTIVVAPAAVPTPASTVAPTIAAAPATPVATSAGATAAPTTSVPSKSAAAASTSRFSPSGIPIFVSLAIHIPAAILWLGIVLYDAIIVAVPYLTPAQRGGLLRRPRWLVLTALPVFTVTGIYQTIYNPISTVTDLASLEALRTKTNYGQALFFKHGFVTASVVLTFAVTFWLAPRLVAFADQTDDGAVTPSRLPVLFSFANVLACLGLLTCVAVIVFQLH